MTTEDLQTANPEKPPASGPSRKWRVLLFVLVTIAVAWIDLVFFDRGMPMLVWFIVSGALIVFFLDWSAGKAQDASDQEQTNSTAASATLPDSKEKP